MESPSHDSVAPRITPCLRHASGAQGIRISDSEFLKRVAHPDKTPAVAKSELCRNLRRGMFMNFVFDRSVQAVCNDGTITLLADCHAAEVASASFAFSSGKRCETISANGNCFCVVRRNSMAIFMWRGSLAHEPMT